MYPSTLYPMTEKAMQRITMLETDKWLQWLEASEIATCDHIHTEIIDSHAGPDSASEEFYCKACGWSHTHIYY